MTLSKKVSVLMDQQLNDEVARQLLEDHPVGTKTDLIIENAEEGALSLLKKWPDMKNKLHIIMNQPLPTPLRQLSWKLYLTNTKSKPDIFFNVNNQEFQAKFEIYLEGYWPISHSQLQLRKSMSTVCYSL